MLTITERTLVRFPMFPTFFLIAAIVGTPAQAQSPDHDALRRLKEIDWPRAYREQDVARLARILADEFQTVRADGHWSTRADELELVRTTRPAYDSLVFEIRRLDVFPNGTAIVGGSGHVHTREGGRAMVTVYESTNVLIKRDGRWQAIASHVSGVRPARPAG